jgi:hypothetical protein
MSRRSVVLAVAAAAFFIAPAIAADTSADKSAKPAKEKKVCRRDMDTGSIMPKTTCHTAAEWVTIDAQNQQNADQLNSQRHMSGTGH